MQVLPVPWNTTAGVDVNNLFDRDSPAVLSAVTNSLDSASVFPAVNAARTTPSASDRTGRMTQLERCVSLAKPPRSCHGRQATRILQCNTQSPASIGICTARHSASLPALQQETSSLSLPPIFRWLFFVFPLVTTRLA